MDYNDFFQDNELLLETIKKANRITEKRRGRYVTLQRAIFLSWWCDKADCKFCYMSTQKGRVADPIKARRKIYRVLAEATICRRIGWDIEFLSGGYGSYGIDEIKEIAEMVAHITGRQVYLNVGVLGEKEIGRFESEVRGIVGSVETVNKKLHKKICPGKPLTPVIKMLEHAKEVGFKTGMTIILGLGETADDLTTLFKLIEDLHLDRITFYSLNPHTGTIYEGHAPPASVYQAGVIALTRVRFPDIKIISGTWIDQLSNIGITLLAGANGITKYPLFTMFGNRYGKKVEEEIRAANRDMLGTFTDLEILAGKKRLERERDPGHVFGYRKPAVSPGAVEKIDHFKKKTASMIEEYISKISKCTQV